MGKYFNDSLIESTILTQEPGVLISTLSSLCPKDIEDSSWGKAPFFNGFDKNILHYLLLNESFTEEISRDALKEISRFFFGLYRIRCYFYAHQDPILDELLDMPSISIHDSWYLNWYLNKNNPEIYDVFYSYSESHYETPKRRRRNEPLICIKRIRRYSSIINEAVVCPSLRSYLLSLSERESSESDYEINRQVDGFLFHVLFMVFILKGFERLDIREYLLCHHRTGKLANLVKDYYHRVVVLHEDICPFSDQIKNDSEVADAIDYEKNINELENRINDLQQEISHNLELANRERFQFKIENYRTVLSVYDMAFGKRIKVFSYGRSVYRAFEEIYLYENGSIVIYGKPFHLTDLTQINPLSETSEELVFGEERMTVECFKPENLVEFNRYLQESRETRA